MTRAPVNVGSGGGGGGRRMLVVVVVLVVVVGGGRAGQQPSPATTLATMPPLLPPSPAASQGVRTEAPPPIPSQLRMRPKDCPLYVLGELRAIKKHGETWINDLAGCELCTCEAGQKRCYYHYCEQGTEVVTNPPSGRPPLDDEDGGEEGEGEGSGRPPPPAIPMGDKLKNLKEKSGPGELRIRSGDNDTRLPVFCGPCVKPCPWGYKMDPSRYCRQCVCRPRCHSLDKCRIQCHGGLATDTHGCPVCQCRKRNRRPDSNCNETIIRGCMDGSQTRDVGEVWSRGPCVSCSCVTDGYTECNVTNCPPAPPCPPLPQHASMGDDVRSHKHTCCPVCQESPPEEHMHQVSVGRAEVTVQSAWDTGYSYVQPREPTPPHVPASDGTVKSAVQAVGVSWWELLLIMISLAVVCVGGVACALKHWRRSHRDKYNINAFRMPSPLTEKVKPVATAEDSVRGRLM